MQLHQLTDSRGTRAMLSTHIAQVSAMDAPGPALRDADVVVWMGDFNYRLSAPYEWVVSQSEAGNFQELIGFEQLRQELARGTVFHGMVRVGCTHKLGCQVSRFVNDVTQCTCTHV